MKRYSLIVFAIVSVANIISILIDSQQGLMISKPLILASLIGYYVVTAATRSSVFIAALVFSLAGDVSLLFASQSEYYFMAGLLSFLVAHILYIITYRQMRIKGLGTELLGTQRIRFSFPILLVGSGLVLILFPSLGALQIPVTIYAAVLVLMVLQALNRFGNTSSQSFWLVMIGALLFFVSDSTLALNKFLNPIPGAEITVMATYIVAQYLITEGIIRHARIPTHA